MATTPEDEDFESVLRKQGYRTIGVYRKRQIMALQTSVESFDNWEHSHRPEQYDVERRAYLAGFEAGSRNERLKKDTND